MPNWSLVSLWGDGHPDLGEVAVISLDDRTALALSRGRFPKPYSHIDPNEDAALAASGTGGRLLAVADGHNGFNAARAAMEAIAQQAPHLLDPDAKPEVAIRSAFETAREAITVAVQRAEGPRQSSRTALSLVLIDRDEAWTATLGDTAVVRVRGGRAKVVSDEAPFLGPASDVPDVSSFKCKDGDRIVAATDGITGYLGSSWEDRLAAVATDAATAEEGARGLLDLAMLGGAGDHLAVVTTHIRL